MTTALTDQSTFLLHDVGERDVRDDPTWRELLGIGAKKQSGRKHLPGQHNQQDHAGLDHLAVLDGIEVLDREAFSDLYGDMADEDGIEFDGFSLAARYFDSGQSVVVIDLPDDRYQVLDETDPEGMRQLAYDIEDALSEAEDWEDSEQVVWDTESGKHGFNVAITGEGQARLQPHSGGGDFVELSAREARDFANALHSIVASYENFEDEGGFDATKAFLAAVAAKFDPGQLRGRDGRWTDGPGSSGAARWLSPDDAMDMRRKMLADEPWTPEQQDALNRYVGDAYYQMNGLLRGDQETTGGLSDGEKAEFSGLIRDAAQGMRPVPEPVKVKRFVSGFETFGLDMTQMTRDEAAEALKAMKGKTLQEPGFMSTSLRETYGNDAWLGKFKIELDVPPGAQGAYLDGDVGFQVEQELLLAPGTRFEITDVVIDPPKNTVKGRVVVE